jgi:flavin reductase (DIM6/NTAB) family NADH-FMN oxidoreductase RutF
MKEIDINLFSLQVFSQIGKKGFLLASGNLENHNCMTVAWAGLGYLWNKPMSFVYVRPQRYTYQFMEKNEYFSMNFLTDSHDDILNFCGTKSGRDTDKMHINGLTPLIFENKVVYYKEASTVFICRKIYFQDLNPENLLIKSVLKNYPLHDFHRIYYGEIEKTFVSLTDEK